MIFHRDTEPSVGGITRRALMLNALLTPLTLGGCSALIGRQFSFEIKATVRTDRSVLSDSTVFCVLARKSEGIVNHQAPWVLEFKGRSPIVEVDGSGLLCALLHPASVNTGVFHSRIADIPFLILTEVERRGAGEWGQNLAQLGGLPPGIRKKLYQEKVSPDRTIETMFPDTDWKLVPQDIQPQLAWIATTSGMASCRLTDGTEINTVTGGLIHSVEFHLRRTSLPVTTTIPRLGTPIDKLGTDETRPVGPYCMALGHILARQYQSMP